MDLYPITCYIFYLSMEVENSEKTVPSCFTIQFFFLQAIHYFYHSLSISRHLRENHTWFKTNLSPCFTKTNTAGNHFPVKKTK